MNEDPVPARVGDEDPAPRGIRQDLPGKAQPLGRRRFDFRDDPGDRPAVEAPFPFESLHQGADRGL